MASQTLALHYPWMALLAFVLVLALIELYNRHYNKNK